MKPWQAENISRRTLARRRKAAVASPTVSSLTYSQVVTLASHAEPSNTVLCRTGTDGNTSCPTSRTTAEPRYRILKEAATAEIVPFPIRATQSWRNIAQTFAGRPLNGRHSKANYAEDIIKANIERLERFGVAPERIAAEVANSASMFSAISWPETLKKVEHADPFENAGDDG